MSAGDTQTIGVVAAGQAPTNDRCGTCLAPWSHLADQQEALRRVATLVARGAPPMEVFAAVAEEVARCVGVDHAVLHRYDADGTTVMVAARDDAAMQKMPVGERFSLEGDNVNAIVMKTGRPARIDDYAKASGSTAERLRKLGLRSAAGAPIIVDGQLWGTAIVGSSRAEPLPSDTEERIAEFADLAATAIANAENHTKLVRSQKQQAGLRRVATLVARGATSSEVFEAVTQEVAGCLGSVLSALLLRYEPEGTYCVLATHDQEGLPKLPLGEHFSLGDDSLGALLFRTGRPTRVDALDDAAARMHEFGLHSGVGAPVIVDGHLWGAAIVASSRPEPLPPDTELRIAEFTDLVATAISNAEARAELQASRVRLVATGDEARRRLERDLHDGAQQRLVCLGLRLRQIEDAVPADLAELKRQIGDTVVGLVEVGQDLQEVSRGIHPVILSMGGLGPTLNTLASRCAVPVVVDFRLGHRMPESVEVAAYYVVAEALTNAVKHARAGEVVVCVTAEGPHLRLSVRDDGIGGANPCNGSGLVGLTDRVQALGGRLRVTSHAGAGTTLFVTIPLNATA